MTCRVIDDLLFGEQNDTVERFSSNRPTDVDALAAQVRAVSHRFAGRPSRVGLVISQRHISRCREILRSGGSLL